MVTLLPAHVAAGGLDVVVGLHGSGSSAVALAAQLAPAMTAAKMSGFACVTVDGGDTYWHQRADGDDPLGMICFEVLPRLAAAGLHTSQIGITGESMGGYGALLLAERLSAGGGPGLAGDGDGRDDASGAAGADVRNGLPAVAAAAALSPAIFGSYADAAAGSRTAFDSPADFARNDVLALAGALRAVPVWVSCGSDDPFAPEAIALRARLGSLTGRPVPGGILRGCHDDAFWNRNLPAALQFLGGRLSPSI